MNTQPKGVYFLEISTSTNGGINEKDCTAIADKINRQKKG
jgi:hypothetical protein